MRRPNLLASSAGRRWVFAALYLSEGAPVGFVWWAMPGLLRAQGVDLASITTLTALATLPWALKFLVAPIIDAGLHHQIRLKYWITGCQLVMAAVLVPLVWIDWNTQFSLVIVVIVAHAIFAATQDVAIDTLAIRTVPTHELGRVNGAMQAGMLGGRAAVAAGSAAIASAFGTPGAAALCVAALILLPAGVLIFATVEPTLEPSRVRFRSVLPLVRSRAALAGAVVALIGGAGFEFFGVSAGPTLVDLGGSDTTMALFYGLLAPAGLAIGAVLGGALTDRIGVVRATTGTLATLTILLSTVALADLTGPILGVQMSLFALSYLAIGFFTASSYALFMALSRGEFAATRFSIFMALTNACEAWAGFAGGRFGAANYGTTLLTLALVACLAAAPLRFLAKIRVEEDANGQRVPA